MLLHELDLLVGAVDSLSFWHCEHVVKFCDEFLDGWDELDDTLWDDDSTEVVAFFSTLSHSSSDVSHHVVE